MKEIIKNIFIDNKFDIISLNQYENTFLAANYREECINFYLVVFLENIPTDFLENQVSELYYTIKGLEKGYDERMDKNLSMLICLHNKQDLEDKQLMKSVFDVEEDPYFFKKYV
ncbi:ABC-three component system middle component 1, partial [Bacillus sp. JJ1127]|uniref:ABC-three component system middle component 1 n=1 Tax=Bacillus sp. JJ1127 TaxID=3122952 RepID=UPI002FFDB9F8